MGWADIGKLGLNSWNLSGNVTTCLWSVFYQKISSKILEETKIYFSFALCRPTSISPSFIWKTKKPAADLTELKKRKYHCERCLSAILNSKHIFFNLFNPFLDQVTLFEQLLDKCVSSLCQLCSVFITIFLLLKVTLVVYQEFLLLHYHFKFSVLFGQQHRQLSPSMTDASVLFQSV